MGKCRTKLTRKGEVLRALSARKVQKRQTTKKVKQNKTKATRKSSRSKKVTTTTGGQQGRSDSLKQTPSTTPTNSEKGSNSGIETRAFKSFSLHYYKGTFDAAASFKKIAVLADGQKVIVGGFNSVDLFSSNMVRLSHFRQRNQPIDITTYNADECIVIKKGRYDDDGLDEFIFMKSSDSRLTKMDYKLKPLHDCRMFAVTACNNKIYSLCDTVPPSLKLFSITRPDQIWSRQTDDDGNALFRHPTCITSFYTTKGVRLIVADTHDDKTVNLVLLDGARGNILRSEQALFRSVVGLTTDKHDNIFVCYTCPIAISVLQKDLSNERVVYKSRNLLTNPSCLVYDETTEQLLVIDNGRTLHTFKLSYK